MALALVRDLRAISPTLTIEELDGVEQDLVSSYVLARAASGVSDTSIRTEVRAVNEFRTSMGRHLWTARPEDFDRYLAVSCLGQSHSTRRSKAFAVSTFFAFLELRHRAEIRAMTGELIASPVDEMNRPRGDSGALKIRIPPADWEIAQLFDGWKQELATTDTYLEACRDYLAARLWAGTGLRIGETSRLELDDFQWDLGAYGKMHIRFGKGSRRRGPKQRLVPLINGTREQAVWFIEQVRGQFDDAWDRPGAPLLCLFEPGRRSTGCPQVPPGVLRSGLAKAVARHLPTWKGRLTPHVLRHYCASSLYRRGMDVAAIGALLGHEWIATTAGYIHVFDTHIEDAWARAAERSGARLERGTP